MLGIVAPLAMERRWLAGGRRHGGGPLVEGSGPGDEKARRAARRLVSRGATALASWGAAAGLDPRLAPGTVVIPRLLVVPGSRLPAPDPAWHAALCEAVRGTVPLSTDPLAHPARLLEDAAAKAELLARLGACAADMESAAVAAVAVEAGVPFLAVRVILDDAETALPAGVARSFGGAEPSPGALLLWRLALDPGGWIGTMDLARAARVAGRSMRTVWGLTGPDLRLGMALRSAGGASAAVRHAHGASGP